MSDKTPPAEGAAPAELAASPEVAKPAEVVHLRGTLVHRPIEPGRKSVAAYLGAELFLVAEDGAESTLRPTEAYPEEALKALAGKVVEVDGEVTEGTLPDPREQYPMTADGAPMRRGAGVLVKAIRAVE
ncbi:MAG: hypothetical protein R3B09_18065 [Nannocystaceae bacterium]